MYLADEAVLVGDFFGRSCIEEVDSTSDLTQCVCDSFFEREQHFSGVIICTPVSRCC